jgi:hypothetical protein
MKNKKEKKRSFLTLDFCGFELEDILINHLESILSDKNEIVYIELMPEKNKLHNKYILNDDLNEFKIYIELKEK